jgi:hypothetical protein
MANEDLDKKLIVVSADSMRKALGQAIETTDKIPAMLNFSPVEQAAVLARLATALKAMDEEVKGIDPKLLVAPGDLVASIIKAKLPKVTTEHSRS